jgi:hypothetical protein
VNSAEERDRLIADLVAREPHVEEEYHRTLARVLRLKAYFHTSAGNYQLHGGGDPDLFKAFAERFMRLVRSGGAVGCVLPRQLIGGAGAQPLRREFFSSWTVRCADVLWNRRVWAFPAVFHRTLIALLAARRSDPGADPVIPSAGPLSDEKSFRRARELRVEYRLKELAAWSPTLELPSLPDAEADRVFKVMARHARFDGEARSWRALPYRELDASGDRDLFNEEGQGWPVWKGRTFDRYKPDIAEPVYWAEPEPVLARLEEKRRSSQGVFGEFERSVVDDPSTLPPLDCRVVFRDVTKAMNTRSMVVCLAPPKVFAIHDAPQLVWPRGDDRDVLYVLGVLNSLPFDWVVRRRVDAHVTFGILNAVPFPNGDKHASRIASLAGRLSCIDDRYSEFAQRSGVDSGPLSELERKEAEAEIDGLVADAYTLGERELRTVFRDFSDRALDSDQEERILAHYRAATRA